IGRKPTLLAGWALFAIVYAGFAAADAAWHVWGLFAAYGLFFGLTEGAERALVADIVPATKRGTAFGWFHLAVGLGALPASVLFGFVWDGFGAPAAFVMGASLAALAALALMIVVPGRRAIAVGE
ncbi:MAG TPA: MFS transporter, partial [Gemmatimonadaceae bacterium]|nr:MFS transporter [Gemmatimonadaceae bacterium]